MRLADHIARDGVHIMAGSDFDTKKVFDWVRRSLRVLPSVIAKGEVIVADEVAAYWMQAHLANNETWNPVKDLPTVAPPFERFLVEFKRPARLEVPPEKAVLKPAGSFYRVDLPPLMGVFFEAAKLDSLSDNDSIRVQAKSPGAFWIMNAVLLLWGADIGVNIVGMFTFALREDGSVIAKEFTPEGDPLFESAVSWFPTPAGQDADEWRRWNLSLLSAIVMPALLTICFLHTDNVSVSTEHPPAALSRRYEQRHGRPMVSYKVLDIRPMQKVIRTEGALESVGLKKAIHIVRGNFRNYRNGRGLFGKLHGLWWWDEHTRGDASVGEVVKDYRVRTGG